MEVGVNYVYTLLLCDVTWIQYCLSLQQQQGGVPTKMLGDVPESASMHKASEAV